LNDSRVFDRTEGGVTTVLKKVCQGEGKGTGRALSYSEYEIRGKIRAGNRVTTGQFTV